MATKQANKSVDVIIGEIFTQKKSITGTIFLQIMFLQMHSSAAILLMYSTSSYQVLLQRLHSGTSWTDFWGATDECNTVLAKDNSTFFTSSNLFHGTEVTRVRMRQKW